MFHSTQTGYKIIWNNLLKKRLSRLRRMLKLTDEGQIVFNFLQMYMEPIVETFKMKKNKIKLQLFFLYLPFI